LTQQEQEQNVPDLKIETKSCEKKSHDIMRVNCTCYMLAFIRLTRSLAVAVIADRTAYDVYDILANYQTGFGYKLTSGWYARSKSTGRVYERT